MRIASKMYVLLAQHEWDDFRTNSYLPMPDTGMLRLFFEEQLGEIYELSQDKELVCMALEGENLDRDVVWQTDLNGDSVPYLARSLSWQEGCFEISSSVSDLQAA